MENVPLVTVVAICYNHERFVTECLDGIQAQTYSNIQLIIMDDCSVDNSASVIRDWIAHSGQKCQFIAHTQNMGLIKTLNEALKQANGKYVSLLSTDDVWLPEFIENHVQIFEDFGESIGIVYGRSFTIDEHGNRLPEMLPGRAPYPEGYVLRKILNRNFIPANTVMIRQSCYERVGYYNEEYVGEGYDMWLRIAQYYQFKFSPEILSNYRILPSSLSHSRPDEVGNTKAKIYLKQLKLYPEHNDLINKNLIYYRESLYRIGHPLAKKYLWLNFKRKPNITDFLMIICTVVGLSYSTYKNFYRILVRQNHTTSS